MSTLTIKSYHVSKVKESKDFYIKKNPQGFYDLGIDLSYTEKMSNSSNLIHSFDISIVNPGE